MKKLVNQIIKFIGFSGIGWIIDFFIYNILNLFSSNIELHNYISSLCGVTFVFLISTRKTFKGKTSRIPLFVKYFIYIAYQILLVFLISKLLVLINSGICYYLADTSIAVYSALISKISVTPVTMIINFVVMKVLIEVI